MFPMMLFGASWLIAQMYLTVNTEEARAGKIIPPPPWLNSLMAIFMFCLFLGKGVVILADRLTQNWLDVFPLVYIGLLAAFLAPVWTWHSVKDKKITWRKAPVLILYAIAATFILALSYKKDDPVTSSHFWYIPILIVAAFLVIAAIAKKENRRQCAIAGLWSGGLVVWLAVTIWVANRIN
jgi:hypothetical protein